MKFKIISFQPLPWTGTIPIIPACSNEALDIPGVWKMGWKDPRAVCQELELAERGGRDEHSLFQHGKSNGGMWELAQET